MAIDGTISPLNSLVAACLLLHVSACSSPSAHYPANGVSAKIDHTPVLEPEQRPPGLIRISAVGDIMLGGTSEPVLQDWGYDYPFENVKYLFDDSDILIGNLEGPLTHAETPFEDKQYLFHTPPEMVAPALKKAGFNIMNLANNHIMDYGAQGLSDTLHALDTAGIKTVGAGNNLEQARHGTIMKIRDRRIGFLGYSLTFPKSFWARADRPGTAFGHEHQIREDIIRLKQVADIVVVSYHWGQEKSKTLRDYQPVLARAAIDAGASAVLGHHPHVLQAVEHYKHGVILYSLGNFTFGSYSQTADTSVVANITFSHEGLFHSLELIPINVLNVEVNFQPRLLENEQADRVIEHLNLLSQEYNTSLRNENGVAFLQKQPNISQSAALMD
jgi:poly-gamma-glutamate synthesis protein (capsule biosynthesis protein)